mgnify:CR=1 FL=1
MKENPHNQYTIRSFSNRQCLGIEVVNEPKSPSSIPVFEAVIAQLQSKKFNVLEFSNVFTPKQGATTAEDKTKLLTSPEQGATTKEDKTELLTSASTPKARPGALKRGGAGASETPNLQNTLDKDIKIKKETVEKEIEKEILKAQKEIAELKKNSISSIQKVSENIASDIIETISGDKLNDSSIKATVEDVSKKNIGKYL